MYYVPTPLLCALGYVQGGPVGKLLLLLGAHMICLGCSPVIHLKCQVTHSTYHKMNMVSTLHIHEIS